MTKQERFRKVVVYDDGESSVWNFVGIFLAGCTLLALTISEWHLGYGNISSVLIFLFGTLFGCMGVWFGISTRKVYWVKER